MIIIMIIIIIIFKNQGAIKINFQELLSADHSLLCPVYMNELTNSIYVQASHSNIFIFQFCNETLIEIYDSLKCKHIRYTIIYIGLIPAWPLAADSSQHT